MLSRLVSSLTKLPQCLGKGSISQRVGFQSFNQSPACRPLSTQSSSRVSDKALDLLDSTARSRCQISHNASAHIKNDASISQDQQLMFSRFRDLCMANYIQTTPTTQKVLELLVDKGATPESDHVAIRALGKEGINAYEKPFLNHGYEKNGPLLIPTMPAVEAYWYEPPTGTGWPKVFISQARLDQLPESIKGIIEPMVGDFYERSPLLNFDYSNTSLDNCISLYEQFSQVPWGISKQDHDSILTFGKASPEHRQIAEYCAWTARKGHVWNHMTLLQNTLNLEGVHNLEDLNQFMTDNNFTLNGQGQQEIQGSEGVGLKQSSLVADTEEHTFSCGKTAPVLGCFIEFIERGNTADGHPMRGFLGNNAAGVFKSTNSR